MSNLLRQGDSNLAAFGQFGGEVIAAGSSSVGNKDIVAITALGAAKLATGTTSVNGYLNIPTTQAIPAGVTVFGRWTVVAAADAAVIAYYGE